MSSNKIVLTIFCIKKHNSFSNPIYLNKLFLYLATYWERSNSIPNCFCTKRSNTSITSTGETQKKQCIVKGDKKDTFHFRKRCIEYNMQIVLLSIYLITVSPKFIQCITCQCITMSFFVGKHTIFYLLFMCWYYLNEFKKLSEHYQIISFLFLIMIIQTMIRN